ncbi:hypothetical protein WICPIJ_002976 [Wickerhamomyces pijperi]|uniref:Carboxylesterase type B domain-containing protein n=1 Tax=Wickerhamomyces pijperi TaxID=599730 RepID=A0A9P8Q800_WICPI|nr:hypothetical protein WICPIJ_002976 [Wickerhamomyces pijperi]
MGQVISSENIQKEHTIHTSIGSITGEILTSSLTKNASTVRYSRIPYALPPVGDLRWKKPVSMPNDHDYTGKYTTNGLLSYQPVRNIELNQHEKDNLVINFPKPTEYTENITYLNIFTPTGEAPKEGWPVYVYLHGGLLQNGDPVKFNPIEMFDVFGAVDEKFILVVPGYRINLFGFLGSDYLKAQKDGGANFGYWDQRESLKWVYKNIEHFGGDKEKVTCGGLSAGANSAFYQMLYEKYHPEEEQIIKRLVLNSNVVWHVPRESSEAQYQELLNKLDLTGETEEEKFEKLKSIDPDVLVKTIPKLSITTFRGILDHDFISDKYVQDLVSGDLSNWMKEKDLKFIIGEVANEGWLYSIANTPKTVGELESRLVEFYRQELVQPLLESYDINEDLSLDELKFRYGQIIGDGQTRYASRGFIGQVINTGFPLENIWRYKEEFMNQFVRQFIKDESFGLIHGFDINLWFHHEGIYSKEEIPKLRRFVRPIVDFLAYRDHKEAVNGIGYDGEYPWRNNKADYFNLLNSNGDVVYVKDEEWERGLGVAQKVYKAQL